MSNFVSISDVREAIEQKMDMQDLYLPSHFLDVLFDVPTANVIPVEEADWIPYIDSTDEYYCSNCNWPASMDAHGRYTTPDPHCRFCGSKMREWKRKDDKFN